jgi:hypothetical protein
MLDDERVSHMAEQLEGEDLKLTVACPLPSLSFLVMLACIQRKNEQVMLW